MPRHREAKTYADAVKLINSFAPDQSRVYVTQQTMEYRDRRCGYVSLQIEYRCSIFGVGDIAPRKLLVDAISAPTPAELVKKVFNELLKQGVTGLPAPRSPRPQRKPQPRRLVQSLPLLTDRRS